MESPSSLFKEDANGMRIEVSPIKPPNSLKSGMAGFERESDSTSRCP